MLLQAIKHLVICHDYNREGLAYLHLNGNPFHLNPEPITGSNDLQFPSQPKITDMLLSALFYTHFRSPNLHIPQWPRDI